MNRVKIAQNGVKGIPGGTLVLFLLMCGMAFVSGCSGFVKASSQAATQNGVFQLSTASINFGNVAVGKQVTQAISVTNTGSVALSITQATLSNSQFSVSGLSMPLSLGTGQSSNFTVAVNPSAAGNVTGTMTILGSAGSSPVVVNLSATATSSSQAQLSLGLSSISFGSVSVGSKNTVNLALNNSGAANLTISSIAASGTGFAVSGIATPATIAAGQSAQATVTFSPTAAGTDNGSISIASNASASPATVTLSGTGVAATLTLSFSTTSLSFGSVNTGSASILPVTVTNTGNANAQLSGISESGAGFTLTNASTPVTLAPNQTMTFDVTFAPTAAGSDSGTVAVTSNASGSPVSISLTGTGAATGHTATLSWTASTSTISGYNVYRSTTNGSGYTKINSALVSGISYVDSAVANGTTYYYVTTAVDGGGNESTYSNQATAVIP